MFEGLLLGTAFLAVGTAFRKLYDPTGQKRELELETDKLNRFFVEAKFGVRSEDGVKYAKAVWADRQPHYDIFGISLPWGLSKSNLEKLVGALENVFRCEVNILERGGAYQVQVIRSKLKSEYPFEVVAFPEPGKLYAILGVTATGPLYFDLTRRSSILIGGELGAGKSVALAVILCQMIEHLTPDELEIIFLDMKKVEAPHWEHVAHVVEVADDLETGKAILLNLESELKERLERIAGAGCKNITEYNKKAQKKMPFRVIVMDELYDYATVMKEIEKPVGNVLSKSRAAGLHFIMATQRPTGDIIPGSWKVHLGVRIGLRCASSQDSINIIEAPGLEQIGEKQVGRGIAKSGTFQKFQAYLLTDFNQNYILKKHFKKRERVVEEYNEFSGLDGC